MSDVIRLGVRSGRMNVKFKDDFEEDTQEVVREEDRLNEMFEEKYELGFLRGREEALNQLTEEYSNKLQVKYGEVEKIVAELDDAIFKYDKIFENLVVKLSIAIGEKIVRREVNTESHINEILIDSVRKVLGSNNIIVRLNSEDYKLLNSESSSLFTTGTFSKIKFEPDDNLEMGGCFIETEIGNVDARLSTQINEINKQLQLALD